MHLPVNDGYLPQANKQMECRQEITPRADRTLPQLPRGWHFCAEVFRKVGHTRDLFTQARFPFCIPKQQVQAGNDTQQTGHWGWCHPHPPAKLAHCTGLAIVVWPWAARQSQRSALGSQFSVLNYITVGLSLFLCAARTVFNSPNSLCTGDPKLDTQMVQVG